MVLTSNGIQSYVIYAYGNLEKHKQKIEVGHHINSDNTSCLLPAYDAENSIQLTCRSNVNIPGIFVVGVTRDSKFQCDGNVSSYEIAPIISVDMYPYGRSVGDSLLSSGDDVSYDVLQNVPFFSPNGNNIHVPYFIENLLIHLS